MRLLPQRDIQPYEPRNAEWAEFRPGTPEREEALFLEAIRLGVSCQYAHHHVGMTPEELAVVVRRLIAQGRLSVDSKYARLRVATRVLGKTTSKPPRQPREPRRKREPRAGPVLAPKEWHPCTSAEGV